MMKPSIHSLPVASDPDETGQSKPWLAVSSSGDGNECLSAPLRFRTQSAAMVSDENLSTTTQSVPLSGPTLVLSDRDLWWLLATEGDNVSSGSSSCTSRGILVNTHSFNGFDTTMDPCYYYEPPSNAPPFRSCTTMNPTWLLFFWTVLRYCKILAYKMARQYYAWPTVLVLGPALSGLLVGYVWGTKQGRIGRNSGPEPVKVAIEDRPDPAIDDLVDEALRQRLTQEKYDNDTVTRESGIPDEHLPRHVAVIMDGNRRYGQLRYQSKLRGHRAGCRRTLEFVRWCQDEGIHICTLYAFSTENWQRCPTEVAALMNLFLQYCRELKQQAVQDQIRVRILSTEAARLPPAVQRQLAELEHDTAHCRGSLQLNICLSYGGRGEIVQACQSVLREYAAKLYPSDNDLVVDEATFERHLATNSSHAAANNVDLVIRTSGEMRLSNFLLWQVAYAELFFSDRTWPEFTKRDFIDILQNYAQGRQRRFGK
jgi:undecaprenyl diphosphate synthase